MLLLDDFDFTSLWFYVWFYTHWFYTLWFYTLWFNKKPGSPKKIWPK